jgi:hypothetical protein
MSDRYGSHSGSGTGSSSSDQEYDDTTLKLQKYAAVRMTPRSLGHSQHDQYGESLIPGFEQGAVLDGVVFQRDDKPSTWKLFGFAEMGFNVHDGKVYETYDAEADEYSDEMTAQEVLDHARVQGFSESFGGNKYWYTPVGVVIESEGDAAVNTDVVDEPDDPEIPIGDVAMFLGNTSWARTFAKLVSTGGHDIIAEPPDDEQTPDDHNWLTTEDPELREELDGREIELFLIEETATFDDDEEVEYTVPVLLDSATGERITLDNEESEEEAESDDGDSGSESAEQSEPEEGEAADEADDTDTSTNGDAPDASEFPGDVQDLIDYFQRQDKEVTAEEFAEFAEGSVDDHDSIDWEAAAKAV